MTPSTVDHCHLRLVRPGRQETGHRPPLLVHRGHQRRRLGVGPNPRNLALPRRPVFRRLLLLPLRPQKHVRVSANSLLRSRPTLSIPFHLHSQKSDRFSGVNVKTLFFRRGCSKLECHNCKPSLILAHEIRAVFTTHFLED
jgi:hypothetical protein